MCPRGNCEQHGPYDAALEDCPQCAQGSSQSPGKAPLEDDPPTVTWRGSRTRGQAGSDDELTVAVGDAAASGAQNHIGNWPEIRQGSWDAEEELPPWPKRNGEPGKGGTVTRAAARRSEAAKDRDLDETVLLREETGLLGFLIIKSGRRRGKVLPIKHGSTVGRTGVDVVLKDSTVDPVHAKFTIEEDCFCVWDFGSEHGTFVNGAKIREATAVQENDVVTFGQTDLELKTLE